MLFLFGRIFRKGEEAMSKSKLWGSLIIIFLFTSYFWANSIHPVHAMHIMEGFLPVGWAIFWWAVTIPFLLIGMKSIQKTIRENPEVKMILGLSGAFAFVLSALKIPSVTGSSSHPTGLGLGTILFGPTAMSVLGTIVLSFQALLLAHGGITTLGANAFSMAVAGPFIAYLVFKGCTKFNFSFSVAVFLAAMFADLGTYCITAMQLALAFPSEVGGILASFYKFAGIFSLTQVPLAISEGLLTVIVMNLIKKYNLQELKQLRVFVKKEA